MGNSNAQNEFVVMTTSDPLLAHYQDMVGPPQPQMIEEEDNIRKIQPSHVNVGRLENIVSDLKNALERTRGFKNHIIKRLTLAIDELTQNNSQAEEVNNIVYKNRLQNIILRVPGSNPDECIKGNSDYQGVFKVRNLAILKCSDEASRIVSVNRQWVMIESYTNNIYNHVINMIGECKKDRTTYEDCFEKSVDMFDRLAAGAIIMMHDFEKYTTKVITKLPRRYFNCYSHVDVDVLKKFIQCLKKGQTNQSDIYDYSAKFKAIQDINKKAVTTPDLEQTLPLNHIPLRRRFN